MLKEAAKERAKDEKYETRPWKCPACRERTSTLKGLKVHWQRQNQCNRPGHGGSFPSDVSPSARDGKEISKKTM